MDKTKKQLAEPCCGECSNFVSNRNYCNARMTRHHGSDTGKAACRDHFTPGTPIYKKNRHGN